MLEIVTHASNVHELRRDGVRVAVVDDIADARKFAAVDELVEADKAAKAFLSALWTMIDTKGHVPDGFTFNLEAVDGLIGKLRHATIEAGIK